MASLTEKLKEVVKASPNLGLDNAKRKLLHIPEESSGESLRSDDESYDRKMAERKKRKRKKMIAEQKRLTTERDRKM